MNYLVPNVRSDSLTTEHLNVLENNNSDILVMSKTLFGEINCNLKELESNASMRGSSRQVVGPSLLFQQRKN